MYFVASDVLFGAPAYLHVEGEKLDATKARASASLPGVSTMVEIDGHRYLDGGTTDSIPFAVAMGLDGAPERLWCSRRTVPTSRMGPPSAPS